MQTDSHNKTTRDRFLRVNSWVIGSSSRLKVSKSASISYSFEDTTWQCRFNRLGGGQRDTDNVAKSDKQARQGHKDCNSDSEKLRCSKNFECTIYSHRISNKSCKFKILNI